MPKESPKPEPGTGAGARHTIEWDVGTIIAALIGLLALLVAGYTAYIQREQVRAQVWPHLQLEESDVLPSQAASGAGASAGLQASKGGYLLATNSGVGPAIVRSVQVEVNGKSEQTWTSVFEALGTSAGSGVETSSLNQMVVPASGHVDFLVVFGQKTWVAFRDKFFKEATLRYCYCSTLGQCWAGEIGKASQLDQPLGGSCPRIPKAGQFRGL